MVDKPVRHWHRTRQSLKGYTKIHKQIQMHTGRDLNVIRTALQGETDWESNTETIHCVTQTAGGLPCDMGAQTL